MSNCLWMNSIKFIGDLLKRQNGFLECKIYVKDVLFKKTFVQVAWLKLSTVNIETQAHILSESYVSFIKLI